MGVEFGSRQAWQISDGVAEMSPHVVNATSAAVCHAMKSASGDLIA